MIADLITLPNATKGLIYSCLLDGKIGLLQKSRSTMPQEEACQHHASSLESKAEMITPLAILNLKLQTHKTPKSFTKNATSPEHPTYKIREDERKLNYSNHKPDPGGK
jgi:hypothetical protein